MFGKEYMRKNQVEWDNKECIQTAVLSNPLSGQTGCSNKGIRMILRNKSNETDQNEELHLSLWTDRYPFNTTDKEPNANPPNLVKSTPKIVMFF